MALFLAGAARIVTVDLNRHLKSELTLAAAARLGSHLETIATASGAALAEVQMRHRGWSKAEQRVQHRRRERRHHRLPGAD